MFTVKISTDIAAQTSKVKAEILRRHAELLEKLGVEILKRVAKAYNEKARGRTGADGITWRDLDRKTLEARVRRRSPARRIVQRRRDLASQIRNTKGKGSGSRIAKLRAKRKERLEKLQSLIDKEVSRHMIGVDTGLQRASASPGFKGDVDGGNVFNVDAKLGQATVGFRRTYSDYFDEDRKLIPERLPADWLESLENIAEEHFNQILKEFEK